MKEQTRHPSLAHLLWPIFLLPLSGWLTYFVTRCPGNPGKGEEMTLAVATYLAPPLLLTALILLLWWHPTHYWLRPVVAAVLACGFLAACVWGFALFAFAVMGECFA